MNDTKSEAETDRVFKIMTQEIFPGIVGFYLAAVILWRVNIIPHTNRSFSIITYSAVGVFLAIIIVFGTASILNLIRAARALSRHNK